MEQPVLLENWLEIGLALAEPYVAECAEKSPGGECFPLSAAIIRVFVVVACVLEVGGPCWGEGGTVIQIKEPGSGGGTDPGEPSNRFERDPIKEFLCDLFDEFGKPDSDSCFYVIPEGAKQWLRGEWGNKWFSLVGPAASCIGCHSKWAKGLLGRIPRPTAAFRTGLCYVCYASVLHLISREGYLVYRRCIA